MGQRYYIFVGRLQFAPIRLQLVYKNVTGLENRDALQRFGGYVRMSQAPFVEGILWTSLEDKWIRQGTEQVDCKGWKGSRE